MKEYAVKPPEVARRYELAPNLFMDVCFGGKIARIFINGNNYIMNDCGQFVVLISNQSREEVTIAGYIDGEPLIDSTRITGENQNVVLSPWQVSKLSPPENPFKFYKELKVIGKINGDEIERTLFFKNSQQTQTLM